MNETCCVYTASTWFCPHDCDDPSHGRHGAAKVFYRGHYYRPGQLITDN